MCVGGGHGPGKLACLQSVCSQKRTCRRLIIRHARTPKKKKSQRQTVHWTTVMSYTGNKYIVIIAASCVRSKKIFVCLSVGVSGCPSARLFASPTSPPPPSLALSIFPRRSPMAFISGLWSQTNTRFRLRCLESAHPSPTTTLVVEATYRCGHDACPCSHSPANRFVSRSPRMFTAAENPKKTSLP